MAKCFLFELDHVQIGAPKGCEGAAREFFGRLLGLEEIEKPESLRCRGGCWFKLGSHQLHIGVEENFQPARKAPPLLQRGRSTYSSECSSAKESNVHGITESLELDDSTPAIHGVTAWSS